MTISFQVEPWAKVLPELRPLFHHLFLEVGLDQDKFKAEYNPAQYAKLAKAGVLKVATARTEKELVGYFAYLITPHPHYFGQGLFALTDMYYLRPEYRKGNTGAKLFLFAEREWRKLGVVKAYTSHKLHRDRSKLLLGLGWLPCDVMYSKVLK